MIKFLLEASSFFNPSEKIRIRYPSISSASAKLAWELVGVMVVLVGSGLTQILGSVAELPVASATVYGLGKEMALAAIDSKLTSFEFS